MHENGEECELGIINNFEHFFFFIILISKYSLKYRNNTLKVSKCDLH